MFVFYPVLPHIAVEPRPLPSHLFVDTKLVPLDALPDVAAGPNVKVKVSSIIYYIIEPHYNIQAFHARDFIPQPWRKSSQNTVEPAKRAFFTLQAHNSEAIQEI